MSLFDFPLLDLPDWTEPDRHLSRRRDGIPGLNARLFGSDARAIAAAAATVGAGGGGAVWVPRGNYPQVAGETIDIPSGVAILAEFGATLDASGVAATHTMMRSLGALTAATLLTADAAEGANTVAATDASAYLVNDYVKVSATTVYGSTNQPVGEIARIASIAGNVLTFYDPLHDAYAVAAGAQVERMDPQSRVVVEGLKFLGPTDTTLSITGLLLELVNNFGIRRNIFARTQERAIGLYDAINGDVTANQFQDIAKTGFAYGISIGWCTQDVTMTANVGQRLRHLVTIGGGTSRRGIPRRILVQGNSASQTLEAGFDAHPAGEDISFIGNAVDGSDVDGIVFQAASGVVAGNQVRNATRHGIFIQPSTARAHEILVANNHIRRAGDRGILVSTSAAWPNFNGIVITGNLILAPGTRGIEVGTSAIVTGLVIGQNIIRGPGGHGIMVTLADYITIIGNMVECAAFRAIYLVTCNRPAISGNSGRITNAAGSYFIKLEATDDASINGNTGTGAQFGLALDANCDNATVLGNNFRACTTPISEAGTGHIIDTADNGGNYNRT